MRLPFNGRRRSDEFMEKIKAERDLTGEEIRQRIVGKARQAGLVWRAERNIRGFNENPFDLVLGNEENLNMCAIEIKGDTDNFSRLSSQLEAYMFGFGEVYVAFHKKEEPDWLPGSVGVLTVDDAGEVYIMQLAYVRKPLEVSTEYEWDALFRANGLGASNVRIRQILSIVGEVRRNVIFNRFFAKPDQTGNKKFETFYPFSEKQLEVIVGFDVEYMYKLMKKELATLEKRFAVLKELVNVGETSKQLNLEFDK